MLVSLDAPNAYIVEDVARVDKDELYASIEDLSSINSRLSSSDGADEAALYLQERFSDYGLDVSTHQFLPTFSVNVIGELRGRGEPDQVVIVGAHYDSRSTDTSNPNLRGTSCRVPPAS